MMPNWVKEKWGERAYRQWKAIYDDCTSGGGTKERCAKIATGTVRDQRSKAVGDHWCDIIEPRESSRYDPWCYINTDPDREMIHSSASPLTDEQMAQIEQAVLDDIEEIGYPSENGIIEQLERMNQMTQENYDYFGDNGNYQELMSRVGFTTKTLAYMGIKTDAVDQMWSQMRWLLSRKVSSPVKLDNNTMWFQIGRSSKRWLYKGIMHYEAGKDTYAIKIIRIDLQNITEDDMATTELEEGWIDGLDAEQVAEYIERKYGNRNKESWVEYDDWKF